MELTKSQLNYIIAIKQLIGSEVSQKYICEYLGVKKPTASIALRNLEDNGYIKRQEKAGINEYCLTDKSWEIIEVLEKEKFEFMTLFNDYFGIDYDSCDKEYKRLCGDFSGEFINKISKLREEKYKGFAERVSGIGNFDEGIYEIPFQVVQCGESTPSMGDKGFKHPAKLIADNGVVNVILEAKEINYKAKNEQKLKGRLLELYYMNSDLKWISSERDKNNAWIIPVENMLYQKDKFGNIVLGIIKIKALATTMKMPESVAEITFNFKLIKKIA